MFKRVGFNIVYDLHLHTTKWDKIIDDIGNI